MKKLYLLTIALLATTGSIFAMDRKKVGFAEGTKKETPNPFTTAQEYTAAYCACLDARNLADDNYALTAQSESHINTAFTAYKNLNLAWASTSKPSGLEITKREIATLPLIMGGVASALNQKYDIAIKNALKNADFGQAYDHLFAWVKLLSIHLNYSDSSKYLKPIDQYYKAVKAHQEQKGEEASRISNGNMATLRIEMTNLENSLK